MKAKDLTDTQLKEFVDSIIKWHGTGILDNNEFRKTSEERYPASVDAIRMFESDILIEAAQRFSKMIGQKPSKLWL